jgi:hypothetical protein
MESCSAVFYRSIVLDALWGAINQSERWSEELKIYKNLLLFKALQANSGTYNAIIVLAEKKNQSKLYGIAKWMAKKIAAKDVFIYEKTSKNFKGERILILSDYLKRNGCVQSLAKKLSEKGASIYAVSLIAGMDPDPSWSLKPVGKDPYHL